MLTAVINRLKPRLCRKTFWWAGALVAIAISVFMAGARSDSKPYVAKVTYGKVHHFEKGFRPLSDAYGKAPDWLTAHLPGRVASAMQFYEMDLPSQTDSLVIWLGVKPQSENDVPDFDVELVDEHGCIFSPRLGDVGGDGRQYVSGFVFDVFPRREKMLKLRYYTAQGNQRIMVGQMTLANPAYDEHRDSPVPASPLPVSAQFGDVGVHLTAFDMVTLKPQLTFEENGVTNANWEISKVSYEDADGNASENLKEFCTRATYIKMKLKMWHSTVADSSNETWHMTTVKVPCAGTFQLLAHTNQIAGSSMQLHGVVGAGQTTFLNGIPSSTRSGFGQDFPKNPITNSVYIKFPDSNFKTIDSIRKVEGRVPVNATLTSTGAVQAVTQTPPIEIACLRPFVVLSADSGGDERLMFLRLRGKKLTQIAPLLQDADTDFIPIEYFEAGEEIEISFGVTRAKDFELSFQSPFAKAQK